MRRPKNQQGAAVITVLCIMALFVAMGLSLLLASSSLLGTARQKQEQEACYQLAKSFSAVVRAQLDAGMDEDGNAVLRRDADTSGTLPAAIFRISERLSSTDEAANATEFLSDDSLGADYGSISLLLRREDYTGDSLSFAAASYDCTLHLTVRVEKGDLHYNYETVYLRRKELETRYTAGEGLDAVPVTKNELGQWVTAEGAVIPPSDVRPVYEDTANTKFSFWYQYGG